VHDVSSHITQISPAPDATLSMMSSISFSVVKSFLASSDFTVGTVAMVCTWTRSFITDLLYAAEDDAVVCFYSK